MSPKKFNPEVRPQDETVIFYKGTKANGRQSHHNLLPGTSKNKKKGIPIDIPNSSQPKYSAVSIDTCNASRFYTTSAEMSQHLRHSRLAGGLKKADESKRKTTPKTYGPGKTTMAQSSDGKNKRNHIRGTSSKENTYQKPHFTNPIAIGIVSSSSSSNNIQSKSLSKKQQALGAGRTPQSSQTHSPHRPYHSFSQNRSHHNHSLPYWKQQPDQRPQREQWEKSVNRLGGFDEILDTNKQFMKKKKKIKTATTNTDNKIGTTTSMDTSDNDEVYHSARSISSDSNDDDDDDDDDDNGKNTIMTKYHSSPTLKRSIGKERSVDTTLEKSRLNGQCLNSTPKRQSTPSPSPSPSLTKRIKTSNFRTKTNHSPDPVELSDEEISEVHNTLFTYPNNRSKGSITVTLDDKKRLEPDQFLNDTIIAFYLKFLMDSYSTPNGYRDCNYKTRAATENTHIFSSFFYNRLTADTGNSKGFGLLKKKTISYENVRKWTSQIDLFSKKYAIFPINENWHWYLVLVCNLDQCVPEQTNINPSSTSKFDRPHIFILDSLGNAQRDTMANINQYLLLEAQHRRNVDPSDFVQPEIHYAKVPKQDNSCDCGVFLLHFVDQFLNSPQQLIRILLDRDVQHSKWKEHEIKDKRMELISLFRKIHRQYSLEQGSRAIF